MKTKEIYSKPQIEIVKIEMESVIPVLSKWAKQRLPDLHVLKEVSGVMMKNKTN